MAMTKKEIAAVSKATYFGNACDACGEMTDSSPAGILYRVRGYQDAYDAVTDVAQWLGLDREHYLKMTGTQRKQLFQKRRKGKKLSPAMTELWAIERLLSANYCSDTAEAAALTKLFARFDIKHLKVVRTFLAEMFGDE